MIRRSLMLSLALCAACETGSGPSGNVNPNPGNTPGKDPVPQDSSQKEPPRLAPAEAYIRSYLMLFGDLSPLQAQTALAAGGSQLFDSWSAYLGSLGLPTYATDFPRGTQTNALMMATFERLGIALCDKAVEMDIQANKPMEQRLIFTFDTPEKLDLAGFTTRFDALHRTFLSYPASMAPTDRTKRFYDLYQGITAGREKNGVPPIANRFKKPAEVGWAAVCYGLIRHPEFHLY
jgi:hypothetical protein